VDDFGALNSALPDPEPTPAEAVSGVALEPTPETAEDASDAPASAAAGKDLPPKVAEGAPDAPAAAAPSAEDPAAVAAETTKHMWYEVYEPLVNDQWPQQQSKASPSANLIT
jgi:hypothetical protein